MESSNSTSKVNANRLFYASCFALITTAFSFAIAAGILDQLKTELELSASQAGLITSMWFAGFPIAMGIGGLIYHKVGGKVIMQFAFFAHAIGILLLIFSGSYTGLLVANLLIGLGNGCTEAACNPMIADAYKGNRMSTMLNRFHMWFPGGIAVGSLLSGFMTDFGIIGQSQVWLLLIPAVIYAYLFYGQTWPKAKIEEAATISGNLKGMLTPLFLFIAVARFFGGSMVAQFNQTGVLLGSAVLATLGIYLFSTQTGAMAYVAAIIFALGVAYFWPNMIGLAATKTPKTGALGMSIIGAIGMFSTSIFQPIIGGWIDADRAAAEAQGFTGDELELVSGQETLGTMVLFPAILIVLFTILYFWLKNKESNNEVAAA